MGLELLIKKEFEFTLVREEIKYYLQVICGTVAIFEITIHLSELEVEQYLSTAENYIEELAKQIQRSPSNFSARSIVSFSHTS